MADHRRARRPAAPEPVWFLWDGGDGVLVFSLPDTARTRNVASNPKVSINFAGDRSGGDIVILSGRATIETGSADRVAAYVKKYDWGLKRMRITPQQFAARYSVPIRIQLTKVRGHR